MWLDGYAIARSSLFDAMAALHKLSTAGFVLVGAQAVYLRTEPIVLPVPAFTLDGDVVADPKHVRKPRAITESLRAAGFTLREHSGLYHRADSPEELRSATRIDVFVPAMDDSAWDLTDYRSGDAGAVMSQAGLELALIDHSPMSLSSPDARPPMLVEVAGGTALIVAKAWKIGERFHQGPVAFKLVGKDVLDLYRLLYKTDSTELAAAFDKIPRKYQEVVATAIAFLRETLCRSGPGLELLPALIGSSTESLRIAESIPLLVEDFCKLAESY